VQRYWKIIDDLSLEAVECTKPDGGVVSTTDRKAVIAFLNLSEDELDLREAQRWISANSWELWRSGMAARLRRWPFDQVWAQVRHTEHDDADGQYSQLRNAGSALYEAGYDPPRARRHWPWQGHAATASLRKFEEVSCVTPSQTTVKLWLRSIWTRTNRLLRLT